jgi:4-oxalomesaconate tautomerase
MSDAPGYDSTGVHSTMLRGGTSRGLFFEAGALPGGPSRP